METWSAWYKCCPYSTCNVLPFVGKVAKSTGKSLPGIWNKSWWTEINDKVRKGADWIVVKYEQELVTSPAGLNIRWGFIMLVSYSGWLEYLIIKCFE